MNRVALVTGASSGIGKVVAQELSAYGFKVFAAARRVNRMEDLKEKGVVPLSLDLTKDDSIQECVKNVLSDAGRIDVLVNNASYGSYGAIEDVPIEEARRQFDVNVFGMARLIQLVTPSIRENHYGKIECLIDAQKDMDEVRWLVPFYEVRKLKPFGIDVIVIEPGGIKTEWGTIAAENLKKTSANGAYAEMANAVADGIIKIYSGDMFSDPEVVAKTIRKAVTCHRPKTRYLIGFGAKPMVWTHSLFGDRVYDWVVNHFS